MKQLQNETAVIYTSKTGFTEKYAKWIAQEMQCEAIPLKKALSRPLKEYDLLIYGGGLTAGMVNGLNKIKNREELKGKRLILFAVGAMPHVPAAVQKVKEDNLAKWERRDVPFFYLEGGIDYDALGFFKKGILKSIYRLLAKKSDKTEEETAMMMSMKDSFDHTRKENIHDLLACARDNQ